MKKTTQHDLKRKQICPSDKGRKYHEAWAGSKLFSKVKCDLEAIIL